MARTSSHRATWPLLAALLVAALCGLAAAAPAPAIGAEGLAGAPCMAATVAPATAPIAVISVTADRLPLWDKIDAVPDANGTLLPHQVQDEIACGRSSRLPHADHAYCRLLPFPYWGRFTLVNADDVPLQKILSFELPSQEGVELWRKAGDGGWAKVALLEDERPHELLSGNVYPAWRLPLAANAQAEFMLRLDGYNLMRFPVYLSGVAAFGQLQSRLYLCIGFILAVPLAVMLYMLTLIRVADDKSLPLFFVMAVSELIGASWVGGLMHAAFPAISRDAGGWIGWCGYALMLGLSCQHARVFLGVRRDRSATSRLLDLGTAVWLILIPAIALLWPIGARLMLLWAGTAHALAMMCLAVRAWSRERGVPRALFAAVWTTYAISGALYVVCRLALWPIQVTVVSNFMQGALVAALLGCAVSARIWQRDQKLKQEVQRGHERALLYAAVHHDLWQPLQSVNLYLGALHQTTSAAQAGKLLGHIEASMNSVNDFMADLQQLSTGKCEVPQRERVRLRDVLAPVIEEYRQECAARQVQLRYRATSAWLETDIHMMRRIVRNLLSNAARYTSPGGRVLVATRRQDGRLWLWVVDNGSGMDEQQVRDCFEPFTRFGDTTRAKTGAGLGLYSVKKLSDGLGVELVLRSIEGRGTSVGLTLEEFREKPGAL